MRVDRASLRAAITYCGLSIREAAELIGVTETTMNRKLNGDPERPVVPEDLAPLADLADTLDAMVETQTMFLRDVIEGRSGVENTAALIRLVIFRRDEDVPAWTRLPFASAHRMACARIARALPLATAIVAFDPESYRAWLGGRDDTDEALCAWAHTQPTGPPL